MCPEQETKQKFLVWLGKHQSEELKLLQQVYGNEMLLPGLLGRVINGDE